MSFEKKIREMLQNNTLGEAYPGAGQNRDASPIPQGSSAPSKSPESVVKGAGVDSVAKAAASAKLSPSAGGRDEKPIPQGDSETNPSSEDLTSDDFGKKAAAKMKQAKPLKNSGAGNVPSAKTVADPRSVVNQASSKGNVWQEEVELEEDGEDEYLTEDEFAALSPEEQAEYEEVEFEDDEDLDEEVNEEEELEEEVFTFDPAVLFDGDEGLTEDFKTKAAGIFEAVVAARVSELREQIENEAADLAAEAFAEQTESLVALLDDYLNEAVATWLEQNEVAVEQGLRTEVTEGFIDGLRNLFAESFIDVPEDRYDLVGELQNEVETVSEQLAVQEEITENVLAELHMLQREQIVSLVSEGMAMTQADRFKDLTEDVTFEDAETFTSKVKAIRENFFSKTPKKDEVLEEGSSTTVAVDSSIKALADRVNRINRE